MIFLFLLNQNEEMFMLGERIIMDKKRTIRLKDSKLCKIRTELRTLLVREANNRVFDLIKEQNILLEKSVFDETKYSLLEDQKNQVRRLIKASISSCANCTDMREDHVFNPNTREWYCEKCYGRLKEGYTKREQPDLFP